MSKFEVGDRVVWIKRSNLETNNEYEDDDCTRGVIKGIVDPGKFSVKWDDSWIKPNPGMHAAEDLMLESEANKILDKLKVEYEAWADPIKENLEQAAKFLSQANKLAVKQGRELYELHNLLRPLMSVMRDEVGWQISSLSC